MYYTDIYKADTTNGTGIRVVLWVSGRSHHCKECHNPQTWAYNNGSLFTEETLNELLTALNKPYISGITFSGGDPLFSRNLSEVYDIILKIKKQFPNKNIWLYSGFTWEEIHATYDNDDIAKEMLLRKKIVELCDVFVDGKFIIEQKNLMLKYCGSENQKVINVPETLKQNKIILYY
jgi:anaerobic ribonucleoside-triphosphate reductase activating protein